MKAKADKAPVCPCCMERHPEEARRYKDSVIFKGVEVEYEATSRYCPLEDAYFDVDEMISNNFLSMKRAYRQKCGLMTAEEITDLRKIYGISQADLCKLLGWGNKTITRYEGHQVQDRAHDLILRKLKDDPAWFIELLEKEKESLSERAYNKCLRKANEMYFKSLPSYEKKVDGAKKLQRSYQAAAI